LLYQPSGNDLKAIVIYPTLIGLQS